MPSDTRRKTISSLLASAETVPAINVFDGFAYVVNPDGETVTIREYREKGALQAIIPGEIDGMRVTDIGFGAFIDCGLAQLTLPDTLVSIGNNAFRDCGALTHVTLPDSVISIGDMAFYRCENLIQVTSPDSVTHIGGDAFRRVDVLDVYEDHPDAAICAPAGSYAERYAKDHGIAFTVISSLQTDAVEEILFSGDYAYSVKDGQSTITGRYGDDDSDDLPYPNPNRLDTADENALLPAFDAEDRAVVFPKRLGGYPVTAIGDCAFLENSFTAITIPEGIVSIGDSTFAYSYYIDAVILPEGLTHVGDGLLEGCEILETVVIPNSVTYISDSMFNGCGALQNVNLPDGITSIGDRAFEGCDSLASLTIPRGVIQIGEDAFASCEKLTLKVTKGSYAARYAQENDIPCIFAADDVPVSDTIRGGWEPIDATLNQRMATRTGPGTKFTEDFGTLAFAAALNKCP